MAGETPIPQGLSSELSKAPSVPEVLKKAPIEWERVKKVDGMLDQVPEIHARGVKITLNEQPDANGMRESTQIKVGNRKTNLVDYITQDKQLGTLLSEGMRMNVVTEQDFKDMGVDYKIFQKGTETSLKLPQLTKLQKAEAMSLILHRLGEANPATTTLYLDEATKLIDPKVVEYLNAEGGELDNQDLLNALAASGREQLSKYIVEQGYQPYEMTDKVDERRLMAKLVEKAYGKEGAKRVLKEETPYFASQKDVQVETPDGVETIKIPVPEYSGLIDIHVAQAMTNALMPAEYHITIATLEKDLQKAATVQDKEDIRHSITLTKQRFYAALLNAYGVVGYKKNEKVLGQFGADQNQIIELADSIKNSESFKETQGKTLFEANRYSLSKIVEQITGLKNIDLDTQALPIESAVEAYRELFRTKKVGERFINDFVRNKLAADFVKKIQTKLNKKEATLSAEERDLLSRFFLNTYDTERSLMRKAHTRFAQADAPTAVKVGSVEAVNQGVKGLDLLFRRTVTEQQYDWENYKKLVIEGAAEVVEQPPGAVLEQGLEKQAADDEKYAQMQEQAFSENDQLDYEKIEKAEKAAVEVELKNQEELRKFQDRPILESLAIEGKPAYETGDVYKNELLEKLDMGLVQTDQIVDTMNSLLVMPRGFEGIFVGPLKWFKERQLSKKDPAKFEQYKQLKEALELSRSLDSLSKEGPTVIDAIEEVRANFFIPKKVEEEEAKV